MSGGYFDYTDVHFRHIAEKINEVVVSRNRPDFDPDWVTYQFSPSTVNLLKEAVYAIARASVYAHRVDWLLCGDDGEESFEEYLNEELREVEKEFGMYNCLQTDRVQQLESENKRLMLTLIDLQREVEHLRGGNH